MKRVLIILLSLLAATNAEPVASQPLTTAVLDFQVSTKELEKRGAEAAVLLNAKLSSAPSLVLVERQEIEKIFGEQELGLSGNVTPDTAAKVGQLTGAKVLVTGRIFGTENKYYTVAKIIGTETSRVYGETATFTSLDSLEGAIDELVPKIVGVIEKRGDTLVAKVEQPEARIERLKKLIAGRKLPSVGVQITEHHVNHAVVDPAVQTEMRLVLQQLGFELVEPASAKNPDVLISGEAFSEMAGRRSNLVSCRSRVEVKATEAGTGKLLRTDRQSDVAVDLAENIAGKAALENAALKLLDRLVPALVADAANR